MKNVFLIAIISMCVCLKAQEKDSIIYIYQPIKTSDVDSIKLQIAKYLIDIGELELNDDLLKSYNSRVYTTSLIDNKILELKKKWAL